MLVLFLCGNYSFSFYSVVQGTSPEEVFLLTVVSIENIYSQNPHKIEEICLKILKIILETTVSNDPENNTISVCSITKTQSLRKGPPLKTYYFQ